MEVLKRLKLFKKLDPNFEIDKIVIFTKEFSYDFKKILPGTYLVGKPFKSFVSDKTIVAIVNLLDYFNNIKSMKNYNKSFNFLYVRGAI